MNKWTFPSFESEALTLVIGLGHTGVAVVRWCLSVGVSVRVIDSREKPQGLEEIKSLEGFDSIDVRLGKQAFTVDSLNNVKTLVISPGISLLDPLVQTILSNAKQQNIEVIGEIELFARALNDMAQQGYLPKTLAITGTNGKTTVAAMTQHILQDCGYHTVAAGNISPTALQALLTQIESNSLPQVWVLELSSFQLETTYSLKAEAVTILNISPDHIDWHGSLGAYTNAKAKLLSMANVAVVNRDDETVMGLIGTAIVGNPIKVVSFGAYEPLQEEDLGLVNINEMQWLSTNKKQILPVQSLQVQGTHNALNAQAAILLGSVIGCGQDAMLQSIRAYYGEPHRMEYVRVVAGVNFINDSKGTNVAATVAALQGSHTPTILIAGGLSKGQDFSTLAQAAKKYAKAVVLIGHDVRSLAQALLIAGVPYGFTHTMKQAVYAAFNQAQEGDTVLLSPACASMDMFRSYEHRGQSFIDVVTELALDYGEVA